MKNCKPCFPFSRIQYWQIAFYSHCWSFGRSTLLPYIFLPSFCPSRTKCFLNTYEFWVIAPIHTQTRSIFIRPKSDHRLALSVTKTWVVFCSISVDEIGLISCRSIEEKKQLRIRFFWYQTKVVWFRLFSDIWSKKWPVVPRQNQVEVWPRFWVQEHNKLIRAW